MILNATRKGLITGILMVLLGLLLLWRQVPTNSALQYLVFLIYGAGIVWAVYGQKGAAFGVLFNQGFRCFVVVALIMALYTFIYFQANGPMIDREIEATKQERLKTAKEYNRTPDEIEQEAKTTRKYYVPIMVSQTIFQYLLIGVIVTVTTAGTLSLSKKN
ncbi:MAG: DUF4199 domain-containing protein [Niabella sp.]|nr:DUF4199 domain-containing protein [Niabella sp.]